MGRIAKKISLKMLMALAIMILIPVSVYAAPSSKNVGSDKWFSSGGLDIEINQFKNDNKVAYTSGHIDISRSQAPDWDDAKDNSFEWDLKLTNSDGKLRLKKSKANSKKTVAFTDPYYMHEADYSWTGYYGFQIDFDMKMPKGYRYKVDSLKADTLNVDANGANRRAMMIYFPKASYETFSDKDEMRKNTLVIHGTNMGIMTLNETIYTNNAIELTLEPNETNISYDANGGSGKMADQEVTYEKNAKIQENGFIRTGYTFNGWNTKKDGSGKSYIENQEVTTAFPSNEKVTLYAQWKEIKVKKVEASHKYIIGKKGEHAKINADVIPKNALKNDLSYKSSNPSTVTVNKEGMLTFNNPGNADITIESSNGKKDIVYVTSYEEIDKDGLSVIKGNTKIKTEIFRRVERNKIKSVDKNDDLEVIGESLNCYYVIMKKDNQECFIKKKDVVIPVVKILITNKSLVIKKLQRIQMHLKCIPSIATERTVTWSSSNTSVATISKNGLLKGKKIGKSTITAQIGKKEKKKKAKKKVKIKAFKNKKWINLKDVKEPFKNNHDEKMQGLTGLDNEIYFIKNHRKKKNRKCSKIYRCRITSKRKNGKLNYKLEKIYTFPENKQLGHANDMVAVKEDSRKALYIAPCMPLKDGEDRIIYKVYVNKNNLSMQVKDIKIVDGKLADKTQFNKHSISKINSVSVWKKDEIQYFILNCKCGEKMKTINYVFKLESGKLRCKYKFKTPVPYEQHGHMAAQQGTSTFIKKNNYYLVVSQGKRSDDYKKKDFEKIWNESYIFRFKLNIIKGKMKAKSTASYRLYAGKKVHLRKGKKSTKKRRFEMEGMYIYKGKIYFNSEGSDNYLDLLGIIK